MKSLTTWINEDEHKRFLKRAQALHTTPYQRMKTLIRIDLGEQPVRAHTIRTSIVFAFMLYSLLASTVILLGYRLPPELFLNPGPSQGLVSVDLGLLLICSIPTAIIIILMVVIIEHRKGGST